MEERLQIDLEVKSGSLRHELPGSAVKALSLDLGPFGFEAALEVWTCLEVEEDLLWPLVKETDPLEVRLQIQGVDDLPTPAPAPLTVQGLCTYRSVTEQTSDEVDDLPVRYRRYRLRFADTARVLWSQHRPAALFADTALGEMLQSQCVQGITLELDWAAVLDEVRPLIFFDLGHDLEGASFYDLLLWICDRFQGSFTYDCLQNRYRLAAEKPEITAPALLSSDEVHRLQVAFCEPQRHELRILNGISPTARTETVTQAQKVDGLFRDVVVREAVAAQATAVKEVEQKRLFVPDHDLDLELRRLPTVAFRPGLGYVFDLQHGGHPLGTIYRLRRFSLALGAIDPNPDADRGLPHTRYRGEMRASLERRDDTRLRLPAYRAPRFPGLAEALVVSDAGEDSDTTYQTYELDPRKEEVYRVMVPVWNQKIGVPYEPLLMPGHFYFPAYRDQPLVVSLWFDRAEIHRFLDWGPRTRVPLSTQGNHLLLGLSRTSQTSIQHFYESSKPVLEVVRDHEVPAAPLAPPLLDEQSIRLEEGVLTLSVGEVEDSAASEEKQSIKPRVEAAQAELTGKTEASMVELSSAYQMAAAGVGAKLGAAIGETKQALDDAESEISDKADEIRGEAESALQEIGAEVGALEAEAEALLADLEGLL